jgi:ssRNA-specific RNase YbeY (16S rRNA maturation enzyme)
MQFSFQTLKLHAIVGDIIICLNYLETNNRQMQHTHRDSYVLGIN